MEIASAALGNIERILSDRPGKLLFTMGFPAIIMALIDELNSFIDAVFMGQYFGKDAVASMSIVLPVMLFMVAFSGLFAEGAVTAISRYLGAKNRQKAEQYFNSSVLVVVVSGIVFGVVCFFLVERVVSLFNVAPQVRFYASIYLKVLGLGLPIFMLVYLLGKMLYAEGKTGALLVSICIQLAVNVVINYVLIALLGVGAMGAALGTLLAQSLQIVILIKYINSDKMILRLRLKKMRVDFDCFKEILTLGMPVFLSMILLSITLGIESTVIAGFGSVALSVQTITGYIFSVSSSLVSGLMGVSLVLLSYCVGAKKIKRFFAVAKLSAKTVFLMVLGVNALLVLNSGLVVSVFTDSKKVIDLIRVPGLVYGLSAPFIFTTNVVLYAMQPVGMEKTSMYIFALQQGVLFIPLLFVLQGFGFVAAVSAQPISEVVGAVLTVILLPMFVRKTKKYIRQMAFAGEG